MKRKIGKEKGKGREVEKLKNSAKAMTCKYKLRIVHVRVANKFRSLGRINC